MRMLRKAAGLREVGAEVASGSLAGRLAGSERVGAQRSGWDVCSGKVVGLA